MERMRYLIPICQDGQQRLRLILELAVCFVVSAAKRKIQSIRIAGINISLSDTCTWQVQSKLSYFRLAFS